MKTDEWRQIAAIFGSALTESLNRGLRPLSRGVDDIASALRDIAGAEPNTKELRDGLKIANSLLDERNKLLEAIPPCGAHGSQCVPHAIDWVNEKRRKPNAGNT